MKAVALFLILFATLVPIASAQTERAPNITFIPEKLSIGSAFVMLANLDTGPKEVVRISVLSPFYGHIPKVGNRYYCYFSNTDPTANCGPSPFIYSGEQQLTITAENQSGYFYNNDFSPSLNVTVGSITLEAGAVVKNTTVSIDVITSDFVDNVSYRVYDYKFEDVNISGNLTMERPTRFSTNLSLDWGTWWIAFYAPKGEDWGSYLLKVVVGPEQLIEPVVLAFGPHIDFVLGPDQTERTSSPICCVRNTIDKELELSAEVAPELAQFLSVQLESSVLGPHANMTYTITVKRLTGLNTINTLVNLVSNGTVVGQIPIDLSISTLGEITSPPTIITGLLTINPTSWATETVTGKTISKNFTLTNPTDKDYGLNWSVSSGLTGIELSMPTTVAANTSITLTATASFATEGKRTGELIIKYDGMAVTIPVLITVYKNITTDIIEQMAKFEEFLANLTEQQKSDLSSAIYSINTSLETASSRFVAGKYDEAINNLEQAKAKLDMLKSVYTVTPPAEFVFDPTVLIIPIVVVVAAIGGYFGWKFFKGLRKPKPIEKELEEEF